VRNLKQLLLFLFSFIITVTQAQITEGDFLKSVRQRDSLFLHAYKQKDTAIYKKLTEESGMQYSKLSAEVRKKYSYYLPDIYYDLCCVYSLTGNKAQALRSLKKSIDAGYFDYAHIQADSDLNNIKNEKEFKYLIALIASSQKKYLDSLKLVIREFKQDTNTIISLTEYANFYYSKYDTALRYFTRAYELAGKLKNDKYRASSLIQIEQVYTRNKNFRKALEINFDLLKLYENKSDTTGIADIWLELGGVYDNLGDEESSILYNKKAYTAYKKHGKNKLRVISSANNIGYKYIILNIPDSALPYFQESNALANNEIKISNPATYAFTLYGLGKVNYQLGNLSIAMSYYKESLALMINKAETSYDNWIHGLICMGLGEVFKSNGHADSAIVYYKKALKTMPEVILLPVIFRNLAGLYKNINKDTAFNYLMMEVKLTDSLNNATNKRDIKNLTLNELERQKSITVKQKQDEEERKQNIQYALIALGIITFIILFLLLSRSFITSTKLIEFFSVMALLIVFEFLNLLLHPYLERITNHTPLMMLLALVCIAALIIPLHHRMEKWSKEKLVEKNKAIRLANAKKTIEKLEIKPIQTQEESTDV
jgi:tetratricopeptide (TPR) repeat protein